MLIIKTTENKNLRQKVIKALQKNDGYCPCKIQKTEDTKCMCKEFIDKKDEGECHCGLFYKEQG